MSMVSIYHGTAYIVQACASTISTMRYALMVQDHCVQGVTLYRPIMMACSSYAHSIYLRAREL